MKLTPGYIAAAATICCDANAGLRPVTISSKPIKNVGITSNSCRIKGLANPGSIRNEIHRLVDVGSNVDYTDDHVAADHADDMNTGDLTDACLDTGIQ